MRHGKKLNHLGRKSAHRKAMLSNMANSLIEHKRITTTVAKAKALRVFVEPILTKSKTDSTHSRRVVFGYLQIKEVVTELFRDIAPKIADRPGGYTRIIRTGNRLGDNAEMCMIELVDFNELMLDGKSEKKATTRRSRRGASGAAKAATPAAKVTEDKAEEVKAETVETTQEVVGETAAAETKAEDVVEETPIAEATSAEEAPEGDDKTDESEEEKKD
jgi:large subunit ribosomal protein L17